MWHLQPAAECWASSGPHLKFWFVTTLLGDLIFPSTQAGLDTEIEVTCQAVVQMTCSQGDSTGPGPEGVVLRFQGKKPRASEVLREAFCVFQVTPVRDSPPWPQTTRPRRASSSPSTPRWVPARWDK